MGVFRTTKMLRRQFVKVEARLLMALDVAFVVNPRRSTELCFWQSWTMVFSKKMKQGKWWEALEKLSHLSSSMGNMQRQEEFVMVALSDLCTDKMLSTVTRYSRYMH